MIPVENLRRGWTVVYPVIESRIVIRGHLTFLHYNWLTDLSFIDHDVALGSSCLILLSYRRASRASSPAEEKADADLAAKGKKVMKSLNLTTVRGPSWDAPSRIHVLNVP